MRKSALVIGVLGLSFFGAVSVVAQTSSGITGLKGHHTSTNNLSAYYKKPALKPSKHKIHNSLRRKGWHTQPDPYIEEGGVYTKNTHPALTTHGDKMQQYALPSHNYVAPPLNVYRSPSSGQQKVQITDPSTGNTPPISLPPVKP